MTTENDRESTGSPAQLMVQEVWSRGDLQLIDDLVTEDYVHYDVALPKPIRGPEAFKETVAMFREGTPDLTKAIKETIVDGNTVVIPYTATGTHKGEILGVAPTDTEIEVEGMFVYRVEDGCLVEGTDLWNAFGLLCQIGEVN
ncbi:ester cyclase [Halomontanus rarus]|uniref:ester cyclase n=1 Tax=Halomontanus rarus TaxID=3034020 RepID=UPI00293BAF84|nr:ester cyclase [Halovivax sp. KZCA124]